jgi:hypothetical protein
MTRSLHLWAAILAIRQTTAFQTTTQEERSARKSMRKSFSTYPERLGDRAYENGSKEVPPTAENSLDEVCGS